MSHDDAEAVPGRRSRRAGLECSVFPASGADSLAEVFDRGVGREWNRVRALVDGHDAHDPDAIREVRGVYALASSPAATPTERERRLEALSTLRYLDQAGLACGICAPMSACEIEDEIRSRQPSGVRRPEKVRP